MNQTTSNAASSTISAEAISNRAYELWENEGRPEGSDQRHWFQAEQELRGTSERNGEDSATTPSRDSDVTPLKGTRAGAAAARSSSSPTSTTTASLGSSSPKPAGKRTSANPFPGKKPTPAL